MEAEMTRSSQLCKRRPRAEFSQWREEQVQIPWGKKSSPCPRNKEMTVLPELAVGEPVNMTSCHSYGSVTSALGIH